MLEAYKRDYEYSLSINGRKLACSGMHNFDVCITLEIQNYLMGVRIVMQNLNVRVIEIYTKTIYINLSDLLAVESQYLTKFWSPK